MSDLVFKSVVELAQMIRDRHLSAIELLDAHLKQIAQHNSKLNAICTLDEKTARIRAKQADEALERRIGEEVMKVVVKVLLHVKPNWFQSPCGEEVMKGSVGRISASSWLARFSPLAGKR